MITRIKNGKIITDKCIEENKFVYFNDNKIQAITENILPYDYEIDAGGNYVSPGFIDLHNDC